MHDRAACRLRYGQRLPMGLQVRLMMKAILIAGLIVVALVLTLLVAIVYTAII